VLTSQHVTHAWRALITVSIWAPLVLSSEAARADGNSKPPPSHAIALESSRIKAASPSQPEPAANSAPVPNDEQAAAVAFEQAESSYANGDSPAALDGMRESYRLSLRPELLYNVAQLEEELHQCRGSLEDYRRYLERVPNGQHREAAEKASQELARECPAADPAQPSLVREPMPTTRLNPTPDPRVESMPGDRAKYWTPARVIGWSAIAAGALAGTGALYFTLAAKSARDDFARLAQASKHSNAPLSYARQDDQHRDQTWALSLAAVAAELGAGGLIVLMWDPGDANKERASANIFLQPGAVAASLSFRF
jgi:hypothetical protein